MRPLPFSFADGKHTQCCMRCAVRMLFNMSSRYSLSFYSIELMITTADGAQYLHYAIILGMEAMIYGEIKFTFTS